MKNLIFLFLLALLASCTSTGHRVKLKNGTIVNAYDEQYRRYNIYDTVCVVKGSDRDAQWIIDAQGVLLDTTYTDTYKSKDSTLYTVSVSYRIGVIAN